MKTTPELQSRGIAKQRKENSFREGSFRERKVSFYEREISIGPREVFYVPNDIIETIYWIWGTF